MYVKSGAHSDWLPEREACKISDLSHLSINYALGWGQKELNKKSCDRCIMFAAEQDAKREEKGQSRFITESRCLFPANRVINVGGFKRLNLNRWSDIRKPTELKRDAREVMSRLFHPMAPFNT